MNEPTTLTPPDTLVLWLQHRAQIRASRTRLGLVGYAYLLAMLRDQADTAMGLHTRSGLGHSAVYRFLMTLHRLGRLHIAAWRDVPHAPLAAVFAYGKGHDATPPTHRATGRRVEGTHLPAPQLCPGIIAFEHLLRAIEVPASRTEVIAATGLDSERAVAGLQALVQLNLAHVPLWVWRPQGGGPIEHFQLGAGINVPAPRLRKAERRAQLRERTARRRTFEPLAQALHAIAAPR